MSNPGRIHKDEFNRVTAILYPDGRSVRMIYSPHGELSSIFVGDGSSWQKTGSCWGLFDAQGKLVRRFPGEILVTQEGDVVALYEDGSGLVHHADGALTVNFSNNCGVTVDAMARPIFVRYPDGRTSRIAYGADGLLNGIVFPDRSVCVREGGRWRLKDACGSSMRYLDGQVSVTADGEIVIAEPGERTRHLRPDGTICLGGLC